MMVVEDRIADIRKGIVSVEKRLKALDRWLEEYKRTMIRLKESEKSVLLSNSNIKQHENS